MEIMLIPSGRAGLPPRAVDRGYRMAMPQRRTFLVAEFAKIRLLSVCFRILANSATVFILCIGCRQANQLVLPPPPQVTVAQPVARPVNDTIEFVATTQPTQAV